MTGQRGADPSMASVLWLGVTYFAIVFAAGFVLGVLRVYFLIPHLGLRLAELAEMPVMLVVMLLAARYVARDIRGSGRRAAALGVGVLALGLLLTAEVGLALLVQGQSLDEFILTRDPVSGGVYLVMLGVFAILPLLFYRHRHRRRTR